MIIETLRPSGERFFADDMCLDLEIYVRDGTDAAMPGVAVKWLVDGHEHRLDHAATTADHAGIARNKVTFLSPPAGLKRGTIRIQTPDGHIYQIASFFVIADTSGGAGTLLVHPAPVRVVASPPAKTTSTAPSTKAVGNTLTIHYPGDGVKLPWGVPQYAWAQYLDGSGNALKNQTLIPTGDGAVYIDPKDPYPVTDDKGWAAIKLQMTPSLADNPPFAPQDASGKLYVKAQATPGDQATANITFSTTLGGRGYLTVQLPSTATQGDWWPIYVTYRMPDGTPGSHRVLNWDNLSSILGVTPISYSSIPGGRPTLARSQKGLSYTDQDGQSLLYILTNDGYGANISVSLLISADNVLLEPGDYVMPSPVSVTPRATPAVAWPMIWPYAGLATHQPGRDFAVKFYYTENAAGAEGLQVTWGCQDFKVRPTPSPTPIVSGAAVTTIKTVTADTMFTTTITGGANYPTSPPGASQRAYMSLLYAQGSPAGMHVHLLHMSPPDYPPLSSDTWYTFTVQYQDNGVGVGQAVRWLANPPDNIEFQYPYPTTMDSGGKSAIQLRATGLTQDSRIQIRAEVYNPSSGLYDSVSKVYVFATQAGSTETIVVNPITPAPVLYTASTVTATYTKGQSPVPGAYIQWAGSPQDGLSFSPGISQTGPNGVASTQVTAYGPNQASKFTLFASAYDDTTQETVTGSLDVQFQAASSPPAQDAARLDIQSPEGDTLWGMRWHILQASYLFDDGTPVTGKHQVNWSAGGSGAELWEPTTWTDEQGITTNLIRGPGTFQGDLIQVTVHVSATNPLTSTQDSGDLSLVLTANNIEPVSNVMTIAVDGTQPIQSGYPCPVTVKYTQPNLKDPVVDAAIDWAVYPYIEDSAQPPYELSFGHPSPTHTDSDGLSHNTITYNGTKDLEGVILIASAFNPVTGRTDFARQILNFTYVAPLTGIMISRPWANNPDSGNVIPTIPCQVVNAKMTLASGQGGGSIKLTTLPAELGTQIFDATGTQIQPVDDVYTVPTTNGSAEILVGARYASFFQLQAYYPMSSPDPVCTTDLWLTQQGNRYGDSRYPLIIENLDTATKPPVLAIPDKSTWPNPVFTVSIPANGDGLSLNPTANVVILLNYRVAYVGKVADVQLPNSIDLAYAMLQPTGNVIAYVVGSGKVLSQQGNMTFDAQGQAQTYPTTGRTAATLPAPSLVPPGRDEIMATDVVNGLAVQILPVGLQSGWAYQAGDEITVYFYLSGTYPLPATANRYCPSITQPARNIAYLRYTVTEGDALTSGQPKIFDPLPQTLLAGYGAPGTLQLNFKVERKTQNGTTVYWSRATNTVSLDTATVDPAS